MYQKVAFKKVNLSCGISMGRTMLLLGTFSLTKNRIKSVKKDIWDTYEEKEYVKIS